MIKVYCTDGFNEFEGLVCDSEDLDGTFTLKDTDTGQLFKINGWMCSELEVLERNVGDL